MTRASRLRIRHPSECGSRVFLQDEDPPPRSERERRIKEMIGLVENEFGRARYPGVYESMLGIHDAQARSMENDARSGESPYEADVLGLSFEKGGASCWGMATWWRGI